MQILKEDLPAQGTTTRVSEVVKDANPKYIIEAVAVQLGLKPSMCTHLWPHYVAMVRRLALVPCIQCGAASEADMVCDIEGPTFLINRTRAIHKEVSYAFKAARDYLGPVAYTKESELMIFNGFCESCLGLIEDQLPSGLKLSIPTSPDMKTFRNLVAKILRQGLMDEAIGALRRLVVQPTGTTI